MAPSCAKADTARANSEARAAVLVSFMSVWGMIMGLVEEKEPAVCRKSFGAGRRIAEQRQHHRGVALAEFAVTRGAEVQAVGHRRAAVGGNEMRGRNHLRQASDDRVH